ncbi:ankyrin repeat domain-containing protein 39 [Anoplophora glabripennis]|uniref:Ankyrin repeat domain-containing protein 39 n=1 Tax=Anoplophora glabripennis TaxID=217634 RepID=V5FYX3_ANOGL|nr:ankyrin repeat domain-containing protein 39 [Anoplophora glabripennis]
MSHCEEKHCTCTGTIATQSLDELEFERGIWYAAQYGDLERVKKLLSGFGSDPNKRDAAGYTGLHYAARNGHLDVCKILIEKGADVNSVTRVGKATALCRASSAGKKDIVEYLLNKKADPFIQDSDGKTALHRATENKHFPICQILINTAPSLKEVEDNKGHRADLTKIN